MSLRDVALNILNRNQNIQNVPFAQSGIQAIQNNDAKTGEEIANNILNSMGMTKEQALQIAKQRGLI